MRHVTLTSYHPPVPGEPANDLPRPRMPLAVEATGRGVVRVAVGAVASAARGSDTQPVPAAWVDGVKGALRGDWRAGHAVPIDWDALGTTRLQRRIYDHLRGVGPGETTSAAEVAEAVTTDVDEAVGPLPSAADVLAECARNPIPALIPCGRVRPRAAPRPKRSAASAVLPASPAGAAGAGGGEAWRRLPGGGAGAGVPVVFRDQTRADRVVRRGRTPRTVAASMAGRGTVRGAGSGWRGIVLHQRWSGQRHGGVPGRYAVGDGAAPAGQPPRSAGCGRAVTRG